MVKPIVSICLPCFGRVEYVRNTLKSIYEGNGDVSLDDYEVVISDNDPKQAIQELTKEFSYPNLHYHHTECEGFMNSYHVLTYANGLLLKLHNSQVVFRKGALRKMILQAELNKSSKPLIFYTNGFLFKNESRNCASFDNFFQALSYWPSWSNGFCIWKDDFDKIGLIALNKLFPHTSLFITQHDKTNYIINDQHWFDTQRVKGRSGHNKFEAFTIDFPSIVDECHRKGWISDTTKNLVLHDILTEFLPVLLFNKYIAQVENFDIAGYRHNIKKYFPKRAFGISIAYVLLVPFKLLLRKMNSFRNSVGGGNSM